LHDVARHKPGPENRAELFVALEIDAADLPRAVVVVEVAGELGVFRLDGQRRRGVGLLRVKVAAHHDELVFLVGAGELGQNVDVVEVLAQIIRLHLHLERDLDLLIEDATDAVVLLFRGH